MEKHTLLGLAIWCLVAGILFSACSWLLNTTPEYIIPSPSPTQLTTNETYPLPQDCKKIDSSGLPVGNELRHSHIIYLAGKDIDNLNQLWAIDIESGSRKMILETSAYRFYAFGFLNDGYHFVMAGTENFWLSNLAGLPPKLMELTSPELSSIILSNFASNSRIGRGYNSVSPDESPDGIKKATWDLGDPNLVITDNRTQKHVNVIKYDNRGYIEGNWSPDGKYYAFAYSNPFPNEYGKVYIVEADGSNLRELVRYKSANIGLPYWSPDGKKIVYTLHGPINFRPTYYQILTMATGEVKTYGINAEESLAWRNGNDIVWSPDSEWILFFGREANADQQGKIDIKGLKISTGDFYCITDDSLIEIMADWR